MQKIEKICVDQKVVEFLLQLISAEPKHETGGIFLGQYQNNGTCCVVREATGPGPRALKERYRIIFDADYLQQQQDRLLAENPQYRFLGDWHYHPNSRKKLSPTDILGLVSLSEDDDYKLGQRAIIVIVYKRSKNVKMRGYTTIKKTSVTEIPVEIGVI
jgi:integrative and conjugative element protein (TIGR02256 family)